MNLQKLASAEFFLCFSRDTDIEQAKIRFKKRFKQEPDIAIVESGMLWVGPIYGYRKDGQNEIGA